MNRREKILVFAVVGVLAFGIAAKIIRSQVLDRLTAMDREIAAKQKKVKDLADERFRVQIQRRLWAQIASETLATDVNVAYTKMVNELSELTGKHGLTNVAVRPSQANTARNGLTPLIFSIQGEGTLTQMIAFLYDLENLPFVTQMRNMKLTPLSGKQKGMLQLSLKGETIVLPAHKLAPTTQTAVLDENKRKEVHRTALASVKEYLSIAEKNPFEPSKPPPPPAEFTAHAGPDVSGKVGTPINLTGSGANGKAPYKYAWSQTSGPKLAFTPASADVASLAVSGDTVGTTTLELKVTDSDGKLAKATVKVSVTDKGPEAPPPPVVARKWDPARTSTKITALLSTPDTQEVILTGNDKRRRAMKVGDEFDGGKLVYVHPEGAVVVYKEEGKKETEKDFYPLGKLMSEMKPLTEDEQPEVFSIVSLMEKGEVSGLAGEREKRTGS